MPHTATIESLPAAFQMMKAMQADRPESAPTARRSRRWPRTRKPDQVAIKADLHRIMAKIGEADRRNGAYSRWLLTELGNDRAPAHPVR